MPTGTSVERVYQALLDDGKDMGTAARIAQARTGLSLHTGRKPKRKALTFTAALAKGYPEYNPNQDRDESGKWTGGGGGGDAQQPIDTSSVSGIRRSALARLPAGTLIDVQESLGGYDVEVGLDSGGVQQLTYFVPKAVDRPLTLESIFTTPTDGGRQFARAALALVLDTAKSSNASGIRLDAVGIGGYVWPNIGFELDASGLYTPDYFMGKKDVTERIKRAKAMFGGMFGEGRRFNNAINHIVRTAGVDIPARLAKLTQPITYDQMVTIAGGERYLRGQVDKPTLGKALLVGVSASYVLPKAKFPVLEAYVGRARKALAKGYPEYNADQDRDESGKWTLGGVGGSPTTSGVGRRATLDFRNADLDEIMGALTARAQGADVRTSKMGDGGVHVSVRIPGTGGLSFVATPDFQIIKPGLLEAQDTAAGRKFARMAMSVLRDVAVASGTRKLRVAAALSMGGYAWPRMGFDLDMGDVMGARTLRSAIRDRLDWLAGAGIVSGSEVAHVRGLISDDNWGSGTPTKIARLSTVLDLTPQDLDLSNQSFGDALTRMRGRRTLGKVLLVGTSGNYYLARDKFDRLGIIKRKQVDTWLVLEAA